MKTIFRQIRRMLADDGRSDRDFTGQEERLHLAQAHLREAAAGLVAAADLIADFLKMRQ
ncbi:MAG TPA: hypothetical protein VGH70_04590 [Bradyrhizobium sp.]|jgi:hypothetical protein